MGQFILVVIDDILLVHSWCYSYWQHAVLHVPMNFLCGQIDIEGPPQWPVVIKIHVHITLLILVYIFLKTRPMGGFSVNL